jgi:hypothetical protein
MFCSYAISNDDGEVEMRKSNVSGNTGGGIGSAGGTLTLVNSTVSEAGDVVDLRAGTLTLRNSTLSGRVSAIQGELSWSNTLLDGDCSIDSRQTEVASDGYNIESPGDTCGLDPNGSDRVHVTAEQLNLGPIRDNGGPTETHALGAGSVAIDAIPDTQCTPGLGYRPRDQRGEPRPETGGTMCDAGAFEVQP